MTRIEEYREALEKKLAAVCPDRKADGTCDPPEGRTCAMELNLPEIIRAVHAVKSDRIDEYARSIQDTVCVQCINRDEHGECYYRDHLQCCLDNFMLLVVEAIEEVDARHEAEQSAGATS